MFEKNTKCNHEELEESIEKKYKVEIEQLKEEKRVSENNYLFRIKELEFDKDHLETKELKRLNNVLQDLRINIKEVEAKNQMLDKIVDLNADIFDVKNLINQLINKLPEIKLDKLSITNNSCQEK